MSFGLHDRLDTQHTADEVTFSPADADLTLQTGQTITLTVTTKKQGNNVLVGSGWTNV